MVLVLISCSTNERMLFNKTFIAKQNLSYVPINELIKNGPKYDGKLVLVFGYIYLGYGVSSVHYMEFDKKQVGDIKPGICVNLTDLQDINGVPLSESNYSNLKGKKVKLIGYYNYWDESRFLGECKGELSGIIYLSIID
jgi:hypothetical protein